LLTIDRVPLIFSGDEVALAYREVGALFDRRGPSRRALDRTRKLIAVRKQSAALRRGEFAEVGRAGRVYAFIRTQGKDRVLVMLNASDGRRDMSFGVGIEPWRTLRLRDLIEDREVKPKGSPESLGIEPFGSRILRID